MSRGQTGMHVFSSIPRFTPRTNAAHSISSSRVTGNSRPFGVAPRQWPARPIRCSPTAKLRGDPSCTTSSTAPTSMPSSSDAVATTAFSSPDFSRFSASNRFCRDSEP